MAEKINAAIIDQKDTVVVAIEKINAGETVTWRDCFGATYCGENRCANFS